jgi:hypothetical protein
VALSEPNGVRFLSIPLQIMTSLHMQAPTAYIHGCLRSPAGGG